MMLFSFLILNLSPVKGALRLSPEALSLERQQFPSPLVKGEEDPRWHITDTYQGPISEIYFPAGRADVRYVLNIGVDNKHGAVAALTRESMRSKGRSVIDWVLDLRVSEFGGHVAYFEDESKALGTLGMLLDRRGLIPAKRLPTKLVMRQLAEIHPLAAYWCASQVIDSIKYWFVDNDGNPSIALEVNKEEKFFFHNDYSITAQEVEFMARHSGITPLH